MTEALGSAGTAASAAPGLARPGEAAAAAPGERACPALALEARFRQIHRDQMADVPLLNPALAVRALGFRPWQQHWLGVLVTPWFMNLVLFPRVAADWPAIEERASRHYVFPAGVFEFIGSRDAQLGEYQACSLFSPMFDFADQPTACDTALAALQALFEPGVRQDLNPPHAPAAGHALGAPQAPAAADEPAQPPAATGVSKRDFLFGTRRRGSP